MAGITSFEALIMQDAIEELATHLVETSSERIPSEALIAAKIFILDSFGVAIAGTTGPHVSELIDVSRKWGIGENATVWGSAQRLPIPYAAMVNAYQVHNSEFDAIHEAAVVHPMASILAAVFAVSERDGVLSGRDLLTAVILGVDVSCSIGMGSTETLKFFRPATAGSFGAVAALSRIGSFNIDETIAAFGIQLGQIGGTMQVHEEGLPLLGMQLGFCTRSAVMSYDLAAAGVAGARNVLEGDYGYYALFEGGADIQTGFSGLGESWRICGLSHKPFPSGRATHGIIDGILTLRERHNIEASQVVSIRAEVPPLVNQLTGRPMVKEPKVNYARLCIPYVGAVALLRGNVMISDFHRNCLIDKDVCELAQRIIISVRDVGNPNALVPQRVEIEMKDGSVHFIELKEVIGSPKRPLSLERHVEKFRQNWLSSAKALNRVNAEKFIQLIDTLEDIDDCREMLSLLVPAS